VAEAAHLLGLSDKAVRARAARHQLPFRRLGARILFPREELLDFLNKLDGVSLGEALANATRRPA
jgi:excisionase family DNA binding protein